MKITKEIEIGYDITSKGILCYNLESLRYVWGGNLSTTDYTRGSNPPVMKTKEGYLIKSEKVKERMKYIKAKLDKFEPAYNILKNLEVRKR